MAELDFKSMLVNARRQHAQRIRLAKDAAEKARETQTRIEEAGATWLKRHIMPTLERAKRAFRAQGVPTEMGSNFGVLRSISCKPTVWFRCIGPAVTTNGGQVTPTSKPAYFRCDGQTLEIGLGNSSGDEPWSPDTILSSTDVGDPSVKDSIATAIQSILESYYTQLEDDRQRTSPIGDVRGRVWSRAN